MCRGILKLGSSTYSVSCDSDQRLDYTDCLLRGDPVPCSLDFDISSLPPGNHSLAMTVVNECGQRSAVTFDVEIRKLNSTISQGLYSESIQLLSYKFLWQCVCRFYLDQKGHTHHLRISHQILKKFFGFLPWNICNYDPALLTSCLLYTLILLQLKWLDPAR